jgi:menaquinone-dependent protoporphyrinogen oxidase
MSQKILVTYVSRSGSTAGVAEAIGKTLLEKGAPVDVLPMQHVKDLAPYGAVVAGSTIQNKQWLPEALHFVQKHRTVLNHKPFAKFYVFMTLAMRYENIALISQNGCACTGGATVSEGLVGVLDIRKIPSLGDRLKFRLSVALGIWSEGDHRDWNAIREWASGIHSQLLQRA